MRINGVRLMCPTRIGQDNGFSRPCMAEILRQGMHYLIIYIVFYTICLDISHHNEMDGLLYVRLKHGYSGASLSRIGWRRYRAGALSYADG